MKKTKTLSQDKGNNDLGLTNIRVRNNFKNTINSEVIRLNKIKKGSKKIIPADIVEILLPLLSDEHIEHLLLKTITGSDRRLQGRKNYIKKHGFISEVAFFDLIQDREINLDDYLPAELKLQNRAAKNELTKVNKNVNFTERSA